jgi:GTPase
VRSERAIVSELPGTTRDAVDILYQRDGRAFVFIDTAGIRRRGKQSTSVEIFSVMRAERSIRRADLCILIVDLTAGVTAQDKRIAGLIQAAQKPAIIVLNKWDLVKPKRNQKQAIGKLVEAVRQRIFFLDYAPVLITSSLTGEHVGKLFGLIEKIRRAAQQHVGTGVLNRLLRQAFEANPPATIRARRLKLFYAAQSKGKEGQQLQAPEFVLFANDPRLLNQTYERYLESRIRRAQPFPGLPIILTLRPRANSVRATTRLRVK